MTEREEALRRFPLEEAQKLMPMTTAGDLVEHNKQLLNQYRNQFQQTFGVPLTRFMHPLFGFDIVAFDTWLGTPDGTSTADYLVTKKGKQALSLVENLIGAEPRTIPQTLHIYGPDSAARRFLDEMERLYRSDHKEYQRRKKLIYQAIKERGRGKIKTYPDISLTDLRQILHELDMLYG